MSFWSNLNPIKALYHTILQRTLGRFVERFSSDDFDISVRSGTARFSNLKVKSDLLESLGLPLQLEEGVLESVTLDIPWTFNVMMQIWQGDDVSAIEMAPIKLQIEGVRILLKPIDLADSTDKSLRRLRASLAAAAGKKHRNLNAWFKHHIMQKLLRWKPAMLPQEGDGAELPAWLLNQEQLVDRVFRVIRKSLHVQLLHVHVRYVDAVSEPTQPFAIGLTLKQFTFEGCEGDESAEAGAAGVEPPAPAAVIQLATIHNKFSWSGLALYVRSIPLHHEDHTVLEAQDYAIRDLAGRGRVQSARHYLANRSHEINSRSIHLNIEQIVIDVQELHFRHVRSVWAYFRYFEKFSRYQRILRPVDAHRQLLSSAAELELHQWLRVCRQRAHRAVVLAKIVAASGAQATEVDRDGAVARGSDEIIGADSIQDAIMAPLPASPDPYEAISDDTHRRIRTRARQWWWYARDCVLRDLRSARFSADTTWYSRARDEYVSLYKRLWGKEWQYIICPSSQLPGFDVSVNSEISAAERSWLFTVPPRSLTSRVAQVSPFSGSHAQLEAAEIRLLSIQYEFPYAHLQKWRIQAETELVLEHYGSLQATREAAALRVASTLDSKPALLLMQNIKATVDGLYTAYPTLVDKALLCEAAVLLWSHRIVAAAGTELGSDHSVLKDRLVLLATQLRNTGMDVLPVLRRIDQLGGRGVSFHSSAAEGKEQGIFAWLSPTKSGVASSRVTVEDQIKSMLEVNVIWPATTSLVPATVQLAPYMVELGQLLPDHNAAPRESDIGERADAQQHVASLRFISWWLANRACGSHRATTLIDRVDKELLNTWLAATPIAFEDLELPGEKALTLNVVVQQVSIVLYHELKAQSLRLDVASIVCNVYHKAPQETQLRASCSAMSLVGGLAPDAPISVCHAEKFIPSYHHDLWLPDRAEDITMDMKGALSLHDAFFHDAPSMEAFLTNGLDGFARHKQVDCKYAWQLYLACTYLMTFRDTLWQTAEDALQSVAGSIHGAITKWLLVPDNGAAQCLSPGLPAAIVALMASKAMPSQSYVRTTEQQSIFNEVFATLQALEQYLHTKLVAPLMWEKWCCAHGSFQDICKALARSTPCCLTRDFSLTASEGAAASQVALQKAFTLRVYIPMKSLLIDEMGPWGGEDERAQTRWWATGKHNRDVAFSEDPLSPREPGPAPAKPPSAASSSFKRGWLAYFSPASCDQTSLSIGNLCTMRRSLQALSVVDDGPRESLPGILLGEMQYYVRPRHASFIPAHTSTPLLFSASLLSSASMEAADTVLTALPDANLGNMKVELDRLKECTFAVSDGEKVVGIFVTPSLLQRDEWLHCFQLPDVDPLCTVSKGMDPPRSFSMQLGALAMTVYAATLTNAVGFWQRTRSAFLQSVSTRPPWSKDAGWRPTSYLQDVKDAVARLNKSTGLARSRSTVMNRETVHFVFGGLKSVLHFHLQDSNSADGASTVPAEIDIQVGDCVYLDSCMEVSGVDAWPTNVQLGVISIGVRTSQHHRVLFVEPTKCYIRKTLQHTTSCRLQLGDTFVNLVPSVTKVLPFLQRELAMVDTIHADQGTMVSKHWEREEHANISHAVATISYAQIQHRQEIFLRISSKTVRIRVTATDPDKAFECSISNVHASVQQSALEAEMDDEAEAPSTASIYHTRRSGFLSVDDIALAHSPTGIVCMGIHPQGTAVAVSCGFSNPDTVPWKLAGEVADNPTHVLLDRFCHVRVGSLELRLDSDIIDTAQGILREVSFRAPEMPAVSQNVPLEATGCSHVFRDAQECYNAARTTGTDEDIAEILAEACTSPLEGLYDELKASATFRKLLAGALLFLGTGDALHLDPNYHMSVMKYGVSIEFDLCKFQYMFGSGGETSFITAEAESVGLAAWADQEFSAVVADCRRLRATIAIRNSNMLPRQNKEFWAGIAGGVMELSLNNISAMKLDGPALFSVVRSTLGAATLTVEHFVPALPPEVVQRWYGVQKGDWEAGLKSAHRVDVCRIGPPSAYADKQAPRGRWMNAVRAMAVWSDHDDLLQIIDMQEQPVDPSFDSTIEVFVPREADFHEVTKRPDKMFYLYFPGLFLHVDPLSLAMVAHVFDRVRTKQSQEDSPPALGAFWRRIVILSPNSIFRLSALANGVVSGDSAADSNTPVAQANTPPLVSHSEIIASNTVMIMDTVRGQTHTHPLTTVRLGMGTITLTDISPSREDFLGGTTTLDGKMAEAMLLLNSADTVHNSERRIALQRTATMLEDHSRPPLASESDIAMLQDPFRPYRTICAPASSIWKFRTSPESGPVAVLQDSPHFSPAWLLENAAARSILYTPWLYRLLCNESWASSGSPNIGIVLGANPFTSRAQPAKRTKPYFQSIGTTFQLWVRMVLPLKAATEDLTAKRARFEKYARDYEAAASTGALPSPPLENIDISQASFIYTALRDCNFAYFKRWLDELKAIIATTKSAVDGENVWIASMLPRFGSFDFLHTMITNAKLIIAPHSSIPDRSLVMKLASANIINQLLFTKDESHSGDGGHHRRMSSVTAMSTADRERAHRKKATIDVGAISDLLVKEHGTEQRQPTQIGLERIMIDMEGLALMLVEPDARDDAAASRVLDLSMLHFVDTSHPSLQAYVRFASQMYAKGTALPILGSASAIRQSNILASPRMRITFDSPIGVAARQASPVQAASDIFFPVGAELVASAAQISLLIDILKMNTKEPSNFIRLLPDVVGETVVSTKIRSAPSMRIQYIEKYGDGVVPFLKLRPTPDNSDWSAIGNIPPPPVPPLIVWMYEARNKGKKRVVLPESTLQHFSPSSDLIDERSLLLAKVAKALTSLQNAPEESYVAGRISALQLFQVHFARLCDEMQRSAQQTPMTVLDLLFIQNACVVMPRYIRVLCDHMSALAKVTQLATQQTSDLQQSSIRLIQCAAAISRSYQKRIAALTEFLAPTDIAVPAHMDTHSPASYSRSVHREDSLQPQRVEPAAVEHGPVAVCVPPTGIYIPMSILRVFVVLLPILLLLAGIGLHHLLRTLQ